MTRPAGSGLYRNVLAGAIGLSLFAAGCSSPAISVPGTRTVGDWLAPDPQIPPPQEQASSRKPKPSPAVSSKTTPAKSGDSPNKPNKPKDKETLPETDDGLTRLQEILSQDQWSVNLELKNWLEKQAELGAIPSKNSLVLSPNQPGRSKKTNIYDELNRKAGSKIRSGNYMTRDKEAADLGPISLNRWYHGAIESETFRPDRENVKYLTAQILLESPERSVLSTNAAILLARLGVEKAKPFLLEAVESENLSIPIRGAAAESFASLQATTNEELLRLIERYAERLTPPEPGTEQQIQFQPGTPDLVIELLQSLSERMQPNEAACFAEALRSRDSAVRLCAVTIWRDHPPRPDAQTALAPTCPEMLTRLVSDPTDERIRIAALIALARWQHPMCERYLRDGISDARLKVRLGAIDALGIAGGPDSVVALREMMHDPSPLVRGRVAASLRTLGKKEELFQFADDKAVEVRNEVAKGLEDSSDPRTRQLVPKMLEDQSARVQKSTIESLQNWPLDLSASILLEEMGSTSLSKRETATTVLARVWPAAASFDYGDRRTEIRFASLQNLKARFAEDYPDYDLPKDRSGDRSNAATASNRRELDRLSLEKGRRAVAILTEEMATRDERAAAIKQLTALGEKLALVVEYLQFNENRLIPEEIYQTVLPQADPIFLALQECELGTIPERRAAAGEIANAAKQASLGPLAAKRLYNLGIRETDTLTLVSMLQAFELSPGEIADQFAIFQLENVVPEVRRRACGILGRSDDVSVAEYLLPKLTDRTPEIVRSALEAIGSLGTLEENEQIDPALVSAAVRPILMRSEVHLQIAAGLALCGWDDPAGREALERLILSQDDKTRLAVAQSLGQIDDPALAPLLIPLLDAENGSLRQAALRSLPKVVGSDYGNPTNKVSLPISERIANWKRWSKGSSRLY